MSGPVNAVDAFASALAALAIKHRWLIIVAAVLSVLAVGSGARHLDFANNYRAVPRSGAWSAFGTTPTTIHEISLTILFAQEPAKTIEQTLARA